MLHQHSSCDFATNWRTRRFQPFRSSRHCFCFNTIPFCESYIGVLVLQFTHSCINIGWGVIIWIVQHGQNRNQDLFGAENRAPALLCCFLCNLHLVTLVATKCDATHLFIKSICPWWVKNRNANFTIWIDWANLSKARSITQSLLLGCHISLINTISGGLFGKSGGKRNSALKKPSSLNMIQNHAKKDK